MPTLYEGYMRIIKNLILRNKLRTELYNIENMLKLDGYYEKENQLLLLRFNPDEYAKLYNELENKYGILVKQRTKILAQLNQLSGINLFKKYNYENTK